VLGDLHEFDCLAEVLSDYSKKPGQGPKEDSLCLKKECAKLRKIVYFKFVRIWLEMEAARMWESLQEDLLKMAQSQSHRS
jgi:hypothetical protein